MMRGGDTLGEGASGEVLTLDELPHLIRPGDTLTLHMVRAETGKYARFTTSGADIDDLMRLLNEGDVVFKRPVYSNEQGLIEELEGNLRLLRGACRRVKSTIADVAEQRNR